MKVGVTQGPEGQVILDGAAPISLHMNRKT